MGCSVRRLNASLGPLRIEADCDGICSLRGWTDEDAEADCGHAPLLDMAQEQIEAYLSGKRRSFSLPLSLKGTAFEREVWSALAEIPYGQTASYAQIARRIGRQGAYRAVGRACGRNPVLIIVPCHRVIASSGALAGFAAGLEMKRRLLMLEGHDLLGKDRILHKPL